MEMRKIVLIAVVLLLVLAGLPVLAMGAHAPDCPLCPGPDAPIGLALCAALLVAALVFVDLARQRHHGSLQLLARLPLLTTGIERPPQFA